MSGPFAEGTFAGFSNCTATFKRSEGERTAAGFEETGTKTVLDCRADAQESGRSLERLQQLHETGDVLVFVEGNSRHVKPGDSVELAMDDGRALEGTVEEVRTIDHSILASL